MKTLLSFPLPHSHAYLTLLYTALAAHEYTVYRLNAKVPASHPTHQETDQSVADNRLYGISKTEIENQLKIYLNLFLTTKLFSFDIVHFHWIEYIYIPHHTVFGKLLSIGVFVAMTAYMRYIAGMTILITFHNAESHQHRLNPKIERMLFRYSIMIAHAVIVHNNFSKNRLLKLYDKNSIYKEKITIIPQGEYRSHYPHSLSRSSAREILKIDPSAFMILVFGEMRPHSKGIEDLLTVIQTGDDDTLPPKTVFVFAGQARDRGLQERILAQARRSPSLMQCRLEFIPDTEVQRYLKAGDVGIVPYRAISTSGSVMLYQSFDVPVIVSRLPAIEEQLGPDYPLYCKPGDTASIIRAIQKAHMMKKQNQKVSYSHESSHESWDEIAQQTDTVLRLIAR